MTETTLKVNHEMVLSDDLKYTAYNTDTVNNIIEYNTLEKAFRSYEATSLDSSSLTFNIPSLSGGAMLRHLQVEVPIRFQITFGGIVALDPQIAAAPVANNTAIVSIPYGTSPRPFMTELCCFDQFPLSKVFGNREYTINNSSTVLIEDFSPSQIDAMVAQGDLEKMRNAGLEPFADANSHFNFLCNVWGGMISPAIYNDAVTAPNVRSLLLSFNNIFGPADATLAGTSSSFMEFFQTPWVRNAANLADTWAAKRNRGRNIVNSSVTVSAGALGTAVGCGNNQVPVVTASGFQVANYSGVDATYTFTTTIREELWSQFFDNEYTFNKFQWNRLLPASSLNIKFNFNAQYIREALLKIGDHVGQFSTYTVSNVEIPTSLKSSCKLYVHQCKVPLALIPRQSYKILYYAQDRPQGKKQMTANATDRSFSTTMSMANLSQVPEYFLISLPIDKTTYSAAITVNPLTDLTPSPYQLPSTLNLPVTSLRLTFNSDTDLCTHNLDMYTLQQYTLENLQENKDLMNLIVGRAESGVDGLGDGVDILNTTGAPIATTQLALQEAFRSGTRFYQTGSKASINYNGISNSSFYILKLGSQLRLPESYSPSQIINYNLEITAVCKLSELKRAYGDCRSDVYKMEGMTAPLFNSIVAELDVIHFNKRILSISGAAMQNVYVHNTQISNAEFLELRVKFQNAFQESGSKKTVFDSRMMLGGSFFSRLKDKALDAMNWIKPHLDTARSAVDFAKNSVGQDSSLRKYVDMADSALSSVGGMDQHVIDASGRRGRKPAAKVASSDWRKYLQ